MHFVVGIAAFEEEDIAVALESQNVGADAIEEPAVVTDDYRATGKAFETFFECAEGVDVNVVGRFVEKENVTLLFQAMARCKRLRSPPERTPHFFSWSEPEKLKRER